MGGQRRRAPRPIHRLDLHGGDRRAARAIDPQPDGPSRSGSGRCTRSSGSKGSSSWIRSAATPRPIFAPVPSPTLRTLRQYLHEGGKFRRDNTDRLLGALTLAWRGHLPQLLQHAVTRGFLHRADRTVHEQIECGTATCPAECPRSYLSCRGVPLRRVRIEVRTERGAENPRI